jgi:undecaprenyl pyrophosphate phosphatase UppP
MIGIGILSWLSMLPGNRTWRHYIGIITNILLGTAVALFTTMILTDAADNLTSSPWTLPLLVFILLIALILNHVPMSSRARAKKEQ